jgi:ArsR family transcriptional regulator, arsenate/arsenite/antimonite-responsive transcriptional repressor / arsenate reductase (thioredoxin)
MYLTGVVATRSVTHPRFLRLAGHPLRWQLLQQLAHSDRRVRELVRVVNEPQNLLSYHLRQLRIGGLVSTRRSTFDARESYYHLDLPRCAELLAQSAATIHPGLQPHPDPDPDPGPKPAMPTGSAVRVLFLCTGNSARSPMAAALLRHRAGGWVKAVSAGSHPKPLQPTAARVLQEQYGIELVEHRPTHLDTLTRQRFDFVISLCDKVREVCPEFPGGPESVHWSIPDPATAGDRNLETAFTRTATDLDTRIRYLLAVLATAGQPRKVT